MSEDTIAACGYCSEPFKIGETTELQSSRHHESGDYYIEVKYIAEDCCYIPFPHYIFRTTFWGSTSLKNDIENLNPSITNPDGTWPMHRYELNIENPFEVWVENEVEKKNQEFSNIKLSGLSKDLKTKAIDLITDNFLTEYKHDLLVTGGELYKRLNFYDEPCRHPRGFAFHADCLPDKAKESSTVIITEGNEHKPYKWTITGKMFKEFMFNYRPNVANERKEMFEKISGYLKQINFNKRKINVQLEYWD